MTLSVREMETAGRLTRQKRECRWLFRGLIGLTTMLPFTVLSMVGTCYEYQQAMSDLRIVEKQLFALLAKIAPENIEDPDWEN